MEIFLLKFVDRLCFLCYLQVLPPRVGLQLLDLLVLGDLFLFEFQKSPLLIQLPISELFAAFLESVYQLILLLLDLKNLRVQVRNLGFLFITELL